MDKIIATTSYTSTFSDVSHTTSEYQAESSAIRADDNRQNAEIARQIENHLKDLPEKTIFRCFSTFSRTTITNELNINLIPAHGNETLLENALKSKMSRQVKFLSKYPINFKRTNFNSETILQTAVRVSDLKTFSFVLGENFEDILSLFHEKSSDKFMGVEKFEELSEIIRKDFNDKFEAMLVLNENSLNLLMIAVSYENTEIVKFLLKLEIFDVDYEINELSAASIAFELEIYEILFNLILNNAKFPSKFDVNFLKKSKGNEFSDKLFVLICETNVLHTLAGFDNILEHLNKVRKIYPRLKFFYNTKNESLALKLAKNGHFDIIEKLELSLAPHECFQRWIDEETEPKKIYKVQKLEKFSKFNRNLEISEMQSNFYFLSSEVMKIDQETYSKIIYGTIEYFLSIQIMIEIFRFLLVYYKRIIFDFSKSSQTEPKEPGDFIFYCKNFLSFPIEILTGEQELKTFESVQKSPLPQNRFGKFFSMGQSSPINVINTDMYTKSDLYACYGTLAHEVTHHALNLIYENSSRPFMAQDLIRKKEFDIILQKIPFDDLNSQLFAQSNETEIVARTFQFLAHNQYFGSFRINKIKQKIQELLKFLENRVIPDIKNATKSVFSLRNIENLNFDLRVLKNIKERNLKIKEDFINMDLTPALSEIMIVSSNCPILMMTALVKKYEKISVPKILEKVEKDQKLIFANFSQINEFCENITKAFESYANLLLIIHCSEKVNFFKIFDAVLKLSRFNRIIFVMRDQLDDTKVSKGFKMFTRNFEWNFLKNETTQKLKQKKILFFGEEMKLSEIIGDFERVFEFLINDENLKVGDKFEIDLRNHISRTFYDSKNQKFSVEKFIEHTKDLKSVWICDPAGAGKTEALKSVFKSLIQKFPNYWIFFVNLRDVKKALNIYKDYLKSSQETKIKSKLVSFDEVDENTKTLNVIKKVFHHIFDLNAFEKEIFNVLLEKGKVKILFDAFDEISPKYRDIFDDFLKKLEKLSKVQVWITSRLNFDCKNVEIFHLDPLKSFEKKKMVENPKLKNLIEKVENPLMIKLLSKIYDDDASDFSQFDANLSHFYIYEKYFQKMSQHKNLEIFFKAHQAIALETIFDKNFIQKSEFDLENISEFGIISVDTSKKLFFIHQSYAEFLIASFLIERIFDDSLSDSQEVSKLFVEVLERKDLSCAREFIDEKLKINSLKLKSDFVKNFTNIIFMSENSSNVIKNLINENLKSTLELLINLTRKDSITIFKMWVECNNFESVFLESMSAENFEHLWSLSQKIKFKNLKSIFSDDKRNLLLVIAKLDLKLLDDEILNDLGSDHKKPPSDFNSICFSEYEAPFCNSVSSTSSRMSYKHNLIPTTSKSQINENKINLNFWDILIVFRSLYNTEEYISALKQKDENGNTILHYVMNNRKINFLKLYCEEIFRYLSAVEIKKLFSAENLFKLADLIEDGNKNCVDVVSALCAHVLEDKWQKSNPKRRKN